MSAEEAFLSAVINYTNSSTVHFKLSPAYILYAVGRFALQRHYRRGSPASGQAHSVTSIANKMVAMTGKVIQASTSDLSYLLHLHILNILESISKTGNQSHVFQAFCEFTWHICYICPAEAAGHGRRSRLLDGELLWAAELPQARQRPQPAHTAESAGSVQTGAQSLQVQTDRIMEIQRFWIQTESAGDAQHRHQPLKSLYWQHVIKKATKKCFWIC